jgi:hypothetical protein
LQYQGNTGLIKWVWNISPFLFCGKVWRTLVLVLL